MAINSLSLAGRARASRAYAKNVYEIIVSIERLPWVPEELSYKALYHDVCASILETIVFFSTDETLDFFNYESKKALYKSITHDMSPLVIFSYDEDVQHLVSPILEDDIYDITKQAMLDFAEGRIDNFVPSARDRYLYQAFLEYSRNTNLVDFVDRNFGITGLEKYWDILLAKYSLEQMDEPEALAADNLLAFLGDSQNWKM